MASTPARLISYLLLAALAVSCAPADHTPATAGLPSPVATAQRASSEPRLYLAPEVPDALRAETATWGLPVTGDAHAATLLLALDPQEAGSTTSPSTTWYFALVAAFPTTLDQVSAQEMREAWNSAASGALAGRQLYMTPETASTFIALWGQPGPGALRALPADELTAALWSDRQALGLVPFEALEPELKVIKVDGLSPVHDGFVPEDYALKAVYRLQAPDAALRLPPSNRETGRMTTVLLTGVTALVRATAYTMEMKGVTYPGRDVREFMRAADITHVSNEIPFYSACDFPNPSRAKLVFCSHPKYIDLLLDVGTDVVELTGNHFADYGPEAMLETLALYRQNAIRFYGGGADLAEARKPLLLEHHGNRIAFIGCNPVDWGKPPIATETKPGAAPCDPRFLKQTISELQADGYLVIATFQHQEYYSPEARPDQLQDFRMVAEAGAAIVSGSQAHFPQVMEFHADAFIHYGLGNLFFDQMGEIPYHPGIRRQFIDRYVIYDGRLVSVELLTTMLEDYSRPRPMTTEERTGFLDEYFFYSGWAPLVPSPTPQPTATLTPMALPAPFHTLAPTP